MLLTLGISYKTAPIEVREKLAFSQESIPDAIQSLCEAVPLHEVALLSTCNRTEIYCCTALNDSNSAQAVAHWWQRFLSLPGNIGSYFYTHTNEQSVKHMMRVASGVDSMVMGEPQILGQLKSAFRQATELGVTGQTLTKLFHSSFSTAKKIRSKTAIASYPVSVAFAAVSLARQIFSDLSEATVLLIGAGENAELLLQHLATKPLKRLLICNRTEAKAIELANRYGASVLALDKLNEGLAQADIVMSSVETTQPIITGLHESAFFQHSKRRPILMIDLGVPRNIDHSLSHNEDIYLYSVDDLQGIIQHNKKQREQAAKEAEVIIAQASYDYMSWHQAQENINAIRGLRLKVQRYKEEVLQKAYKRLEKGEDPKVVMEVMLHQLTQKIMHSPTINLRRMSSLSQEKISIAKELFNLE